MLENMAPNGRAHLKDLMVCSITYLMQVRLMWRVVVKKMIEN